MLTVSVDWRIRRLVITDSPAPEWPGRLLFVATTVADSVQYGGELMSLMLSTIQQVTLTLQPVDAKGFPAPVDGVPQWSLSNPEAGLLQVAEDGMMALFIAIAPGDTQINVLADARLGEDVVPLTAVLDVRVIPAEAATLTLTPGVPETQP